MRIIAARPPKPWERAGAASTSTTTADAGPKPWELSPGKSSLSREIGIVVLMKVLLSLGAVPTNLSPSQVKLLPQAPVQSRAQLQPDPGIAVALLTLRKRQP